MRRRRTVPAPDGSASASRLATSSGGRRAGSASPAARASSGQVSRDRGDRQMCRAGGGATGGGELVGSARRSSSSSLPRATPTNRISSPLRPRDPRGGRRGSPGSRELLDHPVELPGSEPYAAAVEGGVGAAGDHAAAALGEHDPVAVTPDAREMLEVGGSVARAVGVAPEPRSASRASAPDHQLAQPADHRLSGLVEAATATAEAAAGDLAAYTGSIGPPCTIPVQTSVPPLPTLSRTSEPSCS